MSLLLRFRTLIHVGMVRAFGYTNKLEAGLKSLKVNETLLLTDTEQTTADPSPIIKKILQSLPRVHMHQWKYSGKIPDGYFEFNEVFTTDEPDGFGNARSPSLVIDSSLQPVKAKIAVFAQLFPKLKPRGTYIFDEKTSKESQLELLSALTESAQLKSYPLVPFAEFQNYQHRFIVKISHEANQIVVKKGCKRLFRGKWI